MVPVAHILYVPVVPEMAYLTCKKNVPLKHPIPVNTSLNSSCIFNVVSALATVSFSL